MMKTNTDLTKLDTFIRDYKGILELNKEQFSEWRFKYKLWQKDARKLIEFVVDTAKDIASIKSAAEEIKSRKRTNKTTKDKMLLVLFEERFSYFLDRTRCRLKRVRPFSTRVNMLYDVLSKEEEEMRAYRDVIQNYGAKEITKAMKKLKKEVDKKWEEIPIKERVKMVQDYLSSSRLS